MNKRISRDIDRLMWLVAEENNLDAVTDFEQRFPELKHELGRRIAMVRNLKVARTRHLPEGSIPRFTPPVPAGMPLHFRWAWGMGLLVLCGLALGSYYAARTLWTPVAIRPFIEPVNIDTNFDAPKPKKDEDQIFIQQFKSNDPEDVPNITIEEPAPTRVTIRSPRIKLSELLRRIEKECGLSLELAPNMPDTEVVVNFSNMTGLEMLAELGPKFGFTAFDQGRGKVLVIPALDANAPTDEGVRPVQPSVPSVGSDGGQPKAVGVPKVGLG